ncbi:MAG TPA: undecaprenyl-phosphate glucose phosphotransferase [Candidatus Margulisbacteria bacterium]|nr:MAG: undecaprenyl-phosphate glucose phosphotransferase [Candidatus Margulisbacteria bacterium GWD2_39_127]OGI04003.1 MAG: undecaprenyl-phosphate glucose phosphotransferase [Candidatus Margulisbacteria bacterium GWF2_38_17]HAR62475.1 undecaprenyl-phosphate glucose phosphotransferase [Candidatus Margulisiibacteriota bacterium]
MQKYVVRYSLTLVKLFGDIVIINLGLLFGYAIKFKLYLLSSYFNINIQIENPAAQIEPYLSIMFVYSLLIVFTLYFAGVYKMRYGIFAEFDEIIKIIKGISIGVIEVMAFTFIYKSFPGSRFVLLYSGLFTIFLMSCYHIFILQLQNYFRTKGLGSQKVMIVGSDEMGQSVAERIIKNPSAGFHLVGFVDNKNPEKISYNISKYFNYLGNLDELVNIIKQKRINKVIVTTTDVAREDLEQWYQKCEELNVEFQIIPDYLELISTTVSISDIDGIPIITIRNLKRSWIENVYKRILDISIALFMVLLVSPVMLLTYIMIRITSKGPAVFEQERVGKNSKSFKMYKFRSMMVDAETGSGPKIVVDRDDDRVTAVGKIIRKLSIDELPQLINVLKGDMSIVGPRPEREHFIKKFDNEYPGFSKRLLVKPGITGWAQINGRAALSSRVEEKLRYDLYYIENWSILFDIKIVIKTVLKVIFAKEAY